MRTIKTYIAALSILFTVASCDKEGDKMIVSGLEGSELTATATDIVLSKDNKNTQVLSLVWDNSTLTVSDDSVSIPDGFPVMSLQISATTEFKTFIETPTTLPSQSYAGGELNALAKDAGLPVDVASPLYFRIASRLGSNLNPIYSNLVTVNVTPYFINMSLLYMLDNKQEATLATLYSPTSNGEYTGFVPATSWLGVYFAEGDGVIWGNDGVSGKAFDMSSDSKTMWNCWFPEPKGCYYVTMSTANQEWTATSLPSIAVGGAVEATLEFSSSLNIWSGTITTSSNNALITLSSVASKYNIASGDLTATSTTLAFAESTSGVLTLADATGNITIPTAGTYTLKVNLSNPQSWTYTLTSGEEVIEEEEETIPYLYLAGIDDATTGPNWNFNKFITLGSNGIYSGVVYVNSLWGFKMYTAAAWDNYYTIGASDNSLLLNATGNLPIPAGGEGYYLITADLSTLTYSMTKLGDVVYLCGMNKGAADNWDFTSAPTLNKTSDGVYSGTVQVTTVSAWGFKVYVENENWANLLGGADGTLYYNGNGIKEDAVVGNYSITVNLIDNTYQMTLIQ